MTVGRAFKKVSHVIFDMDGLLLDTEKYYRKAFSDIAKRFNKEYTPHIMSKVVGAPQNDSVRIAMEHLKIPLEIKEFQKEFVSRAYGLMTNVTLMAGAKNLILHLHRNKIPIAVATSSGKQSFELKTKNHKELFKIFHHIVLGSSDPEVKRGKPAPDIFRVCASRFPDKPAPEKCLVFEDSPNGVKSALAAGMQVVMVPDQLLDKELTKEATLAIDSLELFQPELFGLPGFSEQK